MAKRKKSGGQKVAEKAKRDAKKQVDRLKAVKNPNKAQVARLKREEKTVKDANVYIKAANTARDMSYEELQDARAVEMRQRGKLKGADKFKEGMQARAISDLMRAETGRQKGQGTPYVGPGATVVLDDEGNIQRGPQGRVKYQIDPEAYARRFIPQFTPTQEQLDMGLNIQPGLLTPYQQTNFQWLLGGEGLAPTAGGRIPTDFRQDWRTEQWGDVYDKETGLWKRADPDKRQAAVAEQLRRYEAGEFNPTVGSVAGDRWTGKGVGVASADQWLPPGWKANAAKNVARGLGGIISETPYTRPAPKDWSNLRYTYAGSPESELGQVTQTPASRAMFGNQGRALQPWTGGQGVPAGLLNYQVPGGTGFDVTYSGANPSLFDFNQQQNNQSNVVNNTGQAWTGPGGVTDFNAWQDAEYERMYPGRRAAAQAAGFAGLDYWKPGAAEWRASLPGGATSQDWINMYGTKDQQAAGQTAAEQIDAGWIGDEGGEDAHLFD